MGVEDIVSAIYERFDVDGDGISRYDENDNYICDAFELALNQCKQECRITDFIVNEDTLFTSCGYDTGYIDVIWVTPNGEAHQDIRQWEVY